MNKGLYIFLCIVIGTESRQLFENRIIGLTPVWGLCAAQCIAYCIQNQTCGSCSDETQHVWMFQCSEPGLKCSNAGSCSMFGFEGGYIPDTPVVNIVRSKVNINYANLNWDAAAVEIPIVHVIQVQWNEDSHWDTIGLTQDNNYTVVDIGCQKPLVRVASVSRFGSRFFSKPIKIPDLVVGPVQNLKTRSLYYNTTEDEINLVLRWMPPTGWQNSSDLSYGLNPRPIIKDCPGVPQYQRNIGMFFDNVKEEGPVKKVSVRIPGIAKDCQVILQVNARTPCNFGPLANFTVNCSLIEGYKCPPKPYNPPGNVRDVKIVLMPGRDSPKATITWSPPTDLGSAGVISEYWIQWGQVDNMSQGSFLAIPKLIDAKNMSVPGDQLFAEFDVTLNITQTVVGVQIMACSPGHTLASNEWVSPIMNVAPISVDEYNILKGQLLSDQNGFIVVKMPMNDPSVRVFWQIKEEKKKMYESVRSYKFRWGLYENNSIQDSTTAEILKNVTHLDLHQLKHNKTYGIELVAVYDTDDEEDTMEEQWDNTTFHLFTVPFPHSAPSAEGVSSTTVTPAKHHVHSDKNQITLEIVIPVVLVIIATLVIVAIIAIKLRYKLRYVNKTQTINTERFYYQPEQDNSFVDNVDVHIHSITTQEVADKWELPPGAIKLGRVLGEGAFGQVRLGKIRNNVLSDRMVPTPQPPDITSTHTIVAVKLLHDNTDNRNKQEFIKEINIMKEIGVHNNIVSIIGCCTYRDPVCLIVEHVPNGDLLTYLQNIRHAIDTDENIVIDVDNNQTPMLKSADLLSFCRQISMGMEYLSEKGYVHRDLAARNILIGADKILKIGDFGLARYIYDDKIYVNRKGGKLPVKWMSIEAIFELSFSIASDVWSFGVVVFEIVTFGGNPYPGINNKDLLQELKKGYRMEKPENCSQELYDIMLDCWRAKPSDRPSFTKLREQLEKLIEDNSGVEYLQLNINLQDKRYYDVDNDNTSTFL